MLLSNIPMGVTLSLSVHRYFCLRGRLTRIINHRPSETLSGSHAARLSVFRASPLRRDHGDGRNGCDHCDKTMQCIS